mmetsp:Transcript_12920/g.20435  ORF Transcript_12920/g.20435 Transcript_12920/m.20435 type:complete len:278 (-) Transcript_12920:81-914(-)
MWTLALKMFFAFLGLLFAIHIVRELTDVTLAKIFNRPPRVVSFVPFLGSAIAYKKDTIGFLRACQEKYGKVFTINLTGNKMVLVIDDKALSQYHSAKESSLSLYDAVYDFGFRFSLGPANIYTASATHKRIARILSTSENLSDFIKHASGMMRGSFLHYINQTAQQTASSSESTIEAFKLMRIVALDISIRAFLGKFFFEKASKDFISRFIKFEDIVEENTAKSSLLPEFLARGINNKVKAARANLVQEIAKVVKQSDSKEMAPYLTHLYFYEAECS